MKRLGLLWIGVMLAAAATPAWSLTFYVNTAGGSDAPGCGVSPANACATIQFAYTNLAAPNANPPTELRVLPGTYNECVEAWAFPIQDKPVRLVAEDWVDGTPDNTTTIIDGTGVCDGDGNQATPAVTIGGTASHLEGFTITGGGASGVFGQHQVTITNNVITGNNSDLGGGIYFYSGSCYYFADSMANITNNVIDNNAANDLVGGGAGDGGGVYVFARGFNPGGSSCSGGRTDVLIADNEIRNNTIDNQNIDPISLEQFTALGGGIFVLADSQGGIPISDNAAVDVVITRNIITGNNANPTSFSYGGGIWASTTGPGRASIEISDNQVGSANPNEGNVSSADGGGISAWAQTVGRGDHDVSVSGNTIEFNEALLNGGGLDLFLFAGDLGNSSNVTVEAFNNTIFNNSAGFDGGGVLASFNAERSLEAADASLHPSPSNPSPANEMTFTMRNNDIIDNTSQLGGGGAILLPFANADPGSDFDTPICDPLVIPAVADMDFVNNLVSGNLATGAADPGIDVIGGGLLALPATVGNATARVRINDSTVVDNSINTGFVGGIEVQAVTGVDCQNIGPLGNTTLEVTSSIVANNDARGIGGPPPGDDNLTASAIDCFVFGHPNADYETTIFSADPEPGNFTADPLLDPSSFLPHVCSPVFDCGFCPAVSSCNTKGRCAGHLADPDVDDDDQISGVDLLRFAVACGSNENNPPVVLSDPRWDPDVDVNGDGMVDGDDLDLITPGFGTDCAP